MTGNGKVRALLLTLAVVLALVSGAGCGDDDTESDHPAQPTVTTTAVDELLR